MIGGRVSSSLEAEIVDAVGDFPDDVLEVTAGRKLAYVIKYMPAKFGARYHARGAQGLKISDTPGFTWGRATYVAPLACPLSSGIFGRVGVVARIPDHGSWKTFDARDARKAGLYVAWLQQQARYRDIMLTAHSGYLSQLYRDAFRTRYGIDCVLFRPDQSNRHYTSVREDVWMAVTDWKRLPGKAPVIATGFSERFLDTQLTVVLEEEFEDSMGGIHRTALLNLGAKPPTGNLADDIFYAYNSGGIVRIPS
jgi:hypothetical protein